MSILGDIALHSIALPGLEPRQRMVLRHIGDCLTPRMGTNVLYCECGHREQHYNSCRDRHCPLCQGAARARWVADRMAELLPCPYFHVVFTVPHELVALALANRQIFYRILFDCVHQSLKDVGANPENLGARMGGLSVLHTWNQKLAFHPHVHCIVPGGGISPQGDRWVAGNPRFLLPVRRLSAVFRGKLLSTLEQAHSDGELYQNPKGSLDIPRALKKAAAKQFVVYAKAPFGGPQQVLKYLGRYTHRVGISEQRMVKFADGKVSFSWLDRAGHTRNVMSIPLDQFVGKFLLHLLPKGMRKIRYFGYYANRDRGASLQKVRSLIGTTEVAATDIPSQPQPQKPKQKLCSHCGSLMSYLAPPVRLGLEIPWVEVGAQTTSPGPEPNQRASTPGL